MSVAPKQYYVTNILWKFFFSLFCLMKASLQTSYEFGITIGGHFTQLPDRHCAPPQVSQMKSVFFTSPLP